MTVLRPEFPDHSSAFSRSQERDRKTAAIRSAASRRFNAHGVLGARLEDITADLGLTKTSISYYYASKEELVDYFTLMYRMRRMCIAVDTLYKGKFVKGFAHLYDGQEACLTGISAATTHTICLNIVSSWSVWPFVCRKNS